MVSKPAFTSTPSSLMSASLNEAMGATVFMISCVITRKSLLCVASSFIAVRRSKMPRMRLSVRFMADLPLKRKFSSPSSKASIMKATLRTSRRLTTQAVSTTATTTAATTTAIHAQVLISRISLGDCTKSDD